jgi:hypothetical protein
MAAIALALLAVLAAAAAVVVLRLRERRRGPAPLPGRLPPGVRQLAASVSELSDLGRQLSAAGGGLAHKRRTGALLGPR